MELFLTILFAVGHIALVVLFVVLILLALILFLPVVYRVKLKKNGGVGAGGNIHWLFGALWFSFAFDGKDFDRNLRIFGFPIGNIIKSKKKSESNGSGEYEKAKRQPTIAPGEIINDGAEKTDAQDNKEVGSMYSAHRGEDGSIKKIRDREAFEEESKPSVFEKLSFTFKGVYGKLKKASEILKAAGKASALMLKLLKMIIPKKISGYIDFGFDDPATTGYVLGIIGALCIPIPEKLKVTPFFNEKKFECDVKMSGHIFIIAALVYIIKLYNIPEVRALIKGPSDKGSKNKRVNHRRTGPQEA